MGRVYSLILGLVLMANPAASTAQISVRSQLSNDVVAWPGESVDLVQDGGLAGAVLEIKSKAHRFRTRTGRTESENDRSDESDAAPGALPNGGAAPDSSRTSSSLSSSSSSTEGDGDWFQLMLESAKAEAESKSAGISAAYLPYYVEISTEPLESRYSTLYMALFLFCVLFVLIDIDLFVRSSMGSNRGGIKSIKGANWIWPARQAVLYALGIGLVTAWLGVLEGFAISLALSGITVTIETWETYLAIGNVLNMRLIRRTGVGSWIRYRETVVRIRSISLERVGLEHLNGDQFDLPTSSMRRMSTRSWSPKSVALYKMEVTISRASDLRLVRDCVSDLLDDMAPSQSIKNNHIEFLDSSSSETTVNIKVLLPINDSNCLIVQALVEMELQAHGVLLMKDLSDSKSKYGPLRLVQIKKTA